MGGRRRPRRGRVRRVRRRLAARRGPWARRALRGGRGRGRGTRRGRGRHRGRRRGAFRAGTRTRPVSGRAERSQAVVGLPAASPPRRTKVTGVGDEHEAVPGPVADDLGAVGGKPRVVAGWFDLDDAALGVLPLARCSPLQLFGCVESEVGDVPRPAGQARRRSRPWALALHQRRRGGCSGADSRSARRSRCRTRVCGVGLRSSPLLWR